MSVDHISGCGVKSELIIIYSKELVCCQMKNKTLEMKDKVSSKRTILFLSSTTSELQFESIKRITICQPPNLTTCLIILQSKEIFFLNIYKIF